MPKYSDQIDEVFKALADPTRRMVVERLVSGPASTSELAEPFSMSLPSFTQHLGVLERAGLVTSSKQGRTRTYRLSPVGLDSAQGWLADQRRIWESRLDQLDMFLINQQEKK
ncbi:MAG TPA: metalloregulator ArsR/SmtB family transcription factor [Microthrixaceae bacterium]|nr:metalloregulator ArsR/SmtB family transcription factor [Microthrixaceae bacterium]